MDARNLEHAAEFCKLVGAPDLLAYLGLEADVDSVEARARLKARRKYMQGMQGNPKYKQEALFLIKHFASLDAVLAAPDVYLADALHRAESVHLPILEMTVKGVLAGGNLTVEQEQYLLRNAIELGISEQTFHRLLDRLCGEAGIPRHTRPPVEEATPGPQSTGDFYRVLEVPPQAPLTEIEAAWRRKRTQIDALPPSTQRDELQVRVDLAWNVLKDHSSREQYDLASSRTGPPARARVVRPDQAATAPPVRQRSSGPPSPLPQPDATPGRPARLEVDGEPVRSVRLFGRPRTDHIIVRNIGDAPLIGTVTSEAPWIRVRPQQLDPNRKEQQIEVSLDPDALPGPRAEGRVRIQTDAGDAHVDFVVQKTDPRLTALLTGGAVLVGLGLLILLGGVLIQAAGPGSSGLTIAVDPAATEVRLDGQVVGSGSRIHVPEPPLGQVTLQVVHPNFAPYSREIVVERGRSQTVEVELELARSMDFKPTDALQQGMVDAEAAQSIVGASGAGINACIRRVARENQILTGTVRIHIGKDGRAAGFEVQGKSADEPSVQACLARQTAAITFEPLSEGDYATVRYDYTVTSGADAP